MRALHTHTQKSLIILIHSLDDLLQMFENTKLQRVEEQLGAALFSPLLWERYSYFDHENGLRPVDVS